MITIPIYKKLVVKRGLGMLEEADVPRFYELELLGNHDAVFFRMVEKSACGIEAELVAGAPQNLKAREKLFALSDALRNLAMEVPDDIL